MSIFDRFKSKKEKELGKAEAPKESKKAEKTEKAPAKPAKAEKTELKAKKEVKTEVKATKVDVTGIIKAPVVTEKSADMAHDGQYAFEVATPATKIAVRTAIEKAYGVHVVSVRTMIVRGKAVRFGRSVGSRSSWKKAIVTLKAGERLDVYEASAK